MAKPLSERIASARSTDRITIKDLENLISDAELERDRLGSVVQQETAESIRFELTEEDRDEAATRADRAKRSHAAISAAIEELAAKLEAKRDSDNQRAQEAKRAAIRADRDALAERLRNEWPEIEAKIVELLSAVKSNDTQLAAVFGGLTESSSEAVARGLPGNFYNGVSHARRLTELKLPCFSGSDLAWPQPEAPKPDLSREHYLQQRKTMLEERARWKRYVVRPGSNVRASVQTQYGPREVFSQPIVAMMSEKMVVEARKAGCAVEPITEATAIGGPVGVATF